MKYILPTLLAGVACPLILFCSGCCSTSHHGPASKFAQTQPKEAQRYSRLRPTSIGLCDAIYRSKSETIAGVGSSLKDRWTSNPEVVAYGILVYSTERNALDSWRKKVQNIEQLLNQGGALYEYEWNGEKTKEWGWLVIGADGQIVFKESWITEYRSEEDL